MKKHRQVWVLTACMVLLLVSILFSLMAGSYRMTWEELLRTFLGSGDRLQNFTVFQVRLPRIFLALAVGSALGMSGGVLQGITRNPLAEPGMVGINAGSALFVVLWISGGSGAYYTALSPSSALLIPGIAMAGGVASVFFIYLAAYKKGIQPMRFILMGIGVNAGISAVISFYQLNMSKGDYSQVLTWTNGSLWGSSWNYILSVTPLIVLLMAFTWLRGRTLDALALGDELAAGIGVGVQREIICFLAVSSFLAALATSVAGNIAFLGLLGPQIARKLVGCVHRHMLPVAAGISAVILVLADTAARNLFSPVEIPVGIVVSILGVPYFIYLMLREK